MASTTSEPTFVRSRSLLWRILKCLIASLGLIVAAGRSISILDDAM